MKLEQANMLPFFALLRAGVNGTIARQNFVDFDWKGAEDFGYKHCILPLLFDGYKLYYEKAGLEAPIKVKLDWYAFSHDAERHYAEHLEAIRTLSGCLAEHGVQTMVLKGYGLSRCYPIPSHRICGDIDIYHFGDYRKADEILENSFGIKIDRAHHHHTCYKWKGVMVENHYDFVNIYTHPIHKDVEFRLKAIAANEAPILENDILLPSPNLAVLFTFVHSLSEWVSESVPLRQVVDWWLLRKHYDGQIDWPFVEKSCDELGFGNFLRIWTEVSDWLFDEKSDFDLNKLSAEGRRVLDDILKPKYGRGDGRRGLAWWWFRLRRWFGNRWKMKLAYQNESLVRQFFMHVREKFINPANKLTK